MYLNMRKFINFKVQISHEQLTLSEAGHPHELARIHGHVIRENKLHIIKKYYEFFYFY